MHRGYAFLAVAMILTVCGETSAPKEAASNAALESQSSVSNAAVPAAEAEQVTRFACPDGSTVEARYPTTDTAQIIYKGQTVDMRIAPSASGSRYVGGGWEWWTKGMTEGTLSQLKPGEDTASTAGEICTAQ